jgi:hypothetical protein
MIRTSFCRNQGKLFFVLLCLLVLTGAGREAAARGLTLYPTGGELFYLGGSQEKLENAPVMGGRLEYNFSTDHVMSMGLVYAYSKAGIQNTQNVPLDAFLEQHFCFLGYRFGKNWRWFSLGSHVGMGAVVKNYTNVPMVDDGRVIVKQGTNAEYAMNFGLYASFRPFTWLSIGPDFTYMMTTDMDKWIFGGASSYYFRVGGHLGIYF